MIVFSFNEFMVHLSILVEQVVIICINICRLLDPDRFVLFYLVLIFLDFLIVARTHMLLYINISGISRQRYKVLRVI